MELGLWETWGCFEGEPWLRWAFDQGFAARRGRAGGESDWREGG